ncbi:hypothetical protein CWE09_01925 [Aliidiomarina minuta]|uniref:Uncharacterized protein n=1 Tax=Aliidiomarina minuta TaxID=880057 RepID=A0A432W626_9GAMM|nr:hypothetical protein [Aliidiomarina minuta]RUO25520.1 hypothetical protein CWE09_01925 [Aliidiomarina minuta]
MDAYVIIGKPNARKSSVIRSLTGCYNRNQRNILLNNSSQIQIYARVSSLQESKTEAKDFLIEATNTGCNFVIFCLWPNANSKNTLLYPDAKSYLSYFSAQGWNIVKVAVLGQVGTNHIYANEARFPNSTSLPINQTAKAVRLHFGWQ